MHENNMSNTNRETLNPIIMSKYLYNLAFWRLTHSVTLAFVSNKLMSYLYKSNVVFVD